MKKINVPVKGKKYPVYTGSGTFGQIEQMLEKHKMPSRILAVTDANIIKYQKEALQLLLNSTKFRVELLSFAASEEKKSLASAEKIYKALQKRGYGRDSAIIAIGGGITGDVAAFAASTYMRGIKFVNVPTSLLAMVDSSVGGKTGVNFNNAKNFIGTFYQPEFVFIDTKMLDTLEPESIYAGFGELYKTSYLAGKKMFPLVEDAMAEVFYGNYSTVEKAICEAVRFKAGVVVKDEKETGLRKILNLGHTYAHALEAETDYFVKHGLAVIAGLAFALYLSRRKGIMTEEAFNENIKRIEPFRNILVFPKADPEKIYLSMSGDKKNREGKIKFVLLKDAGEAVIDVEASKGEVIAAIKFAQKFIPVRGF